MDFSRIVELFESRELSFARPSSWDDPYERVLQHKHSEQFYAQCWSKKAVSDAMWRIYSSERRGLRIRTSRDKLRSVFEQNKALTGVTYLLKDVEYLNSGQMDGRISEIAQTIKQKI